MSNSHPLATDLLTAVRHGFQMYKGLADKALAQLPPAEWLWRSGPEANSAAVIVQHMVGNLRSRFGDFWTTDGEKPDRNRDQEFEEPASAEGVAELQARWEAAWPLLWAVLDHLEQHPADWLRTVTIRQEPHTVLAALERQVAHYAYHTGQLVQLAKTIRGEAWQTLSIARGRSAEFNAQMQAAAKPDPNLTAPLGV
jgi:hypothetical protein